MTKKEIRDRLNKCQDLCCDLDNVRIGWATIESIDDDGMVTGMDQDGGEVRFPCDNIVRVTEMDNV